jgi:hypothetical protein
MLTKLLVRAALRIYYLRAGHKWYVYCVRHTPTTDLKLLINGYNV